MMPTLHLAVDHLRHLLTSHFICIWLLVLVLVLVCGFSTSGPRHPVFSSLFEEKTPIGRVRPPWRSTLADTLAALVFALFMALFIVCIFYKEDFAYYDDDQLTDFSLRGRSFPPPIWPEAGRFFPLGLQEFNILGLFTKSPAGYHSLGVVQLIIVAMALFAVLNEYRFIYRWLILMTAMVTPSFLVSFGGLNYPERNILFWLAIFVLCLYGYSKTRASIYFVGCLVAAEFALYYKETVVVFIIAYAVSRVWGESYLGRRAGRSWREIAGENSLSFDLLALAAIYVAMFVVTMPLHGHFDYLEEHRRAPGPALLAYAQTDWLPFILLGVFIIRFKRIMSSGKGFEPLWESLAVGALSCFFVSLGLGLFSGYYTAPVDLIAVLYLARVALAWLSNPLRLRVSAVAMAYACLMLHNGAYSAFRIVERKSLIAAKMEFADFLHNYKSPTDRMELFFPYARPYHLMGLSSYLSYRGFHLVGQSPSRDGNGPLLLIESPQQFPHNQCVDYRDYICTHLDWPGKGALIVVLPDDTASRGDVENIGRTSALLFSFKPCEACIPDGSWIRKLYAISAEFSESPLPEHWMQLHVFEKR